MSSCREGEGAAGHSEEIGFEDAREKVQRPSQFSSCCIHRETLVVDHYRNRSCADDNYTVKLDNARDFYA